MTDHLVDGRADTPRKALVAERGRVYPVLACELHLQVIDVECGHAGFDLAQDPREALRSESASVSHGLEVRFVLDLDGVSA